MRKRGLIFCLVFSMILCSFPVNAFSVTQDETANGKILEAKKKYEKAAEDYRLGPAKFWMIECVKNIRKVIQKVAMRKN